MARIEESVTINRPIDNVFTYTTEARNWPKWHTSMPEAEQTSQGPVGVGTTFKGKSRMMGMIMGWTAKATGFEPYKRWGKVIDSGNVVFDDELIFDTVEGGTKFTMVYDVKVGGFQKLFASMINSSMQKQLKQDLVNLKGILESPA